MNSIHLSDKIFATVSTPGSIVCNIALEGVSSMAEIVRRVNDSIGTTANVSGTLTIRNVSRGWSTRSGILLR